MATSCACGQPGCATGEEAYSLAILVAEVLGDELTDFNVRIFATDVDGDAITFARRGVYPASALADVPAATVDRYFNEVDGAFEVKKLIRGMTVFGQHDLGHRAPFPRIDLTLCRNVLIYFTNELQRRALHLFAFSLRDGGYLILGKSETTSPLAEYFVLEQPRLKVYRRQGERALIPASRIKDPSLLLPLRVSGQASHMGVELLRGRRESDRSRQQRERNDNIVLRMPVGVVVVDRRYDIQTLNNAARRMFGVHGPAIGEDFVHLAQGVPSQQLREAIDAALRAPADPPATLLFHSNAPDGEELHLRVLCYPAVYDEQQLEQAETVVVLAFDATADMQRQNELAKQVEQLNGSSRLPFSARRNWPRRSGACSKPTRS